MGKASWGRKKRLVVDIGSSAIRLCELAQTKSGYQLVKYYQKEYSSDPALDEESKKQQRAAALSELLKESKVRSKKAIFGVPGQSVFTRTRSLPPVPEFKVPQIVRYEIQQQIPFSLDQIAMDYQLLGRSEAGGYEVMMAAIKTDVVDKHIETLQSAKKSVDIVDVSPVAAYNWLKHSGEMQSQGECVALIDLGASTTDIIIEKDNLFRFTRPLSVAGNDITLAIAQNFGMNFAEAERLKRERGFAPTGDPQQDGKGGEVIGGSLQRMVTEIMRSFAYFRSMPGGSPVTRVVLCGGGACLRNIVPYLQQQLQIDVRIAQPLTGLAVAPDAQQVSEHPEQASIALGLALRCNESVPVEINLVPPRMHESQRRKIQVAYWAAIFALLFMTLLSTIPASGKLNEWHIKRSEELKSALRNYDPSISVSTAAQKAPTTQYKAELENAKKEIKGIEAKLTVLDDLRSNRNFWLDEMLLINNARPSSGGMWFTSVETTTIRKAGSAVKRAGTGRAGEDDNDDQRSRRGGPLAGRSGGGAASAPAAGGATPGQDGRSVGFALGGGRRQEREEKEDETPKGAPSEEEMESTGFLSYVSNVELEPIAGMASAASSVSRQNLGGRGRSGRGGDDGDGGRRSSGSGGGISVGALGGSRRGSTSASTNPEDALDAFAIPNGFFVKGYARNYDDILMYIDKLETAETVLPNQKFLWVDRVYFTEGSVRELDYNILYNTDLDNWDDAGAMYSPQNSVYSFSVQVMFKKGDTPRPEEGAETSTPDEAEADL